MMQAEKKGVLLLRQQQYSLSAIAEITGLPLSTIKSFLSRVNGKKAIPDPAPRSSTRQTHYKQCGTPLEQTGSGKTRSLYNDRCRSLHWNEHRDLSKCAYAHKQSCEVCGRMLYIYHAWAVLLSRLLRVSPATEGWCNPWIKIASGTAQR